jgi:hypothetical protein
MWSEFLVNQEKIMSDETFWPLTFAGEINPGGDLRILPEDIESYAYPPGRRERYTEAGWEKAKKIGIAPYSPEDFGAIPGNSRCCGD